MAHALDCWYVLVTDTMPILQDGHVTVDRNTLNGLGLRVRETLVAHAVVAERRDSRLQRPFTVTLTAV